jgi:hypothetical protein
MLDDSLSCCFLFSQRREVGTGGRAGQEMAGSGEAKSSAEVIPHDFSEFTTCRKRIKDRDSSSDVLLHWFPVGGRETRCIWLLPGSF